MDAVARLAKAQFGVISRTQMRALGCSDGAIKWRVESGELVRVHVGVFRHSVVPVSWEQRAMAALHAAGPLAALSHSSAAFVLGLASLNERPPATIEVTVPVSRRVHFRGVRAHRSRLEVPSFVLRNGLRATTLAQTFVDLAAVLTEERLEFALDSALLKNRSLFAWLDAHIARLDPRGHSGLPVLSNLLELRRAGSTESVFETRVWRALRRHDFPPPVLQFEVPGVMRVDFAWPAHRVALHVDGSAWHLQESRRMRDGLQREKLQSLGWRSMSLTWRMLEDDAWLARLRTLLNLTAPQRELQFTS